MRLRKECIFFAVWACLTACTPYQITSHKSQEFKQQFKKVFVVVKAAGEHQLYFEAFNKELQKKLEIRGIDAESFLLNDLNVTPSDLEKINPAIADFFPDVIIRVSEISDGREEGPTRYDDRHLEIIINQYPAGPIVWEAYIDDFRDMVEKDRKAATRRSLTDRLILQWELDQMIPEFDH